MSNKHKIEPRKQTLEPNKGKNLEISVGQDTYLRLPIKTDLISEKDDLFKLLDQHVKPYLLSRDLLFISEKVICVLQGRFIPIKEIKPSRLARLLARKVNNKYGTKDFRGFGHGTPMAMELFIQEAGMLRVFFAAAISAITRPLGIKGAFYFLSGKMAKSVDCPMSFDVWPYMNYAKLSPLNPNKVMVDVKNKYGVDVVMVDANYRGVFSLGKSNRRISEKFIYDVFRDNPLGQSDELTPFCIVRKKF